MNFGKVTGNLQLPEEAREGITEVKSEYHRLVGILQRRGGLDMGELDEEGVLDCHKSMCAKSQTMKECTFYQQYKLFLLLEYEVHENR